MVTRDVLVIFALCTLAAVSWWWTWQGDSSPAGRRPSAAVADFYMDRVHITFFDDGGHPGRELIADSMSHFSADERTELIDAELTLHEGNGGFWLVTAEKAVVAQEDDVIDLYGDVTAHRRGGERHEPIVLVTRNLRVDPKRRYAETAERATVRRDRLVLEGIGMRAWFDKPIRLQLRSAVRSLYEPD